MEQKVDNYKYICNKCNYKCKYLSLWTKHINTELHLTGIRKKREYNVKSAYKCNKCTYDTKHKASYTLHVLNEHSTIEERKKAFKFYCKVCDHGTFAKYLHDCHIATDKHKKNIYVRQ